MEIELSDVSGLPDALKAIVKDNKLDLTQLAPAAEIERWKGKAVKAEDEAIERRKELKAWAALGTPQELHEKLAKGADPAIVQQLQAKLAETETAYKARLTGFLRDRAMAELKAELAKVGVVPEGLDVLASFAGQRITFDDEGAMRILSEDGKTPMIGKAQNGGATLADLAAKLATAIPHLVADKGAGGGGKPAGSNGGTPGTKTITRAQWDAMSHLDRAKHAQSGGKVVD